MDRTYARCAEQRVNYRSVDIVQDVEAGHQEVPGRDTVNRVRG